MDKMLHETIKAKASTAIVSFLGGLSISFFWVPENLRKHGGFLAGAVCSLISSIAGLFLTGTIVGFLNIQSVDKDSILSIAYAIGLCSVAVIGAIANFFKRHQNDDIVEIASEIKKEIRGENQKCH